MSKKQFSIHQDKAERIKSAFNQFGSFCHVLKYAFTLAGSGLVLLLILANSSTLAWYLAWKIIFLICTLYHSREIYLCPPCIGANNSFCLYLSWRRYSLHYPSPTPGPGDTHPNPTHIIPLIAPRCYIHFRWRFPFHLYPTLLTCRESKLLSRLLLNSSLFSISSICFCSPLNLNLMFINDSFLLIKDRF